MAKVNVIKKSKELTDTIGVMNSQLNTLSRNAYQLEKELAKKKAEFAKRDEELRAKQAAEEAPAQTTQIEQPVVQQEPEKTELEKTEPVANQNAEQTETEQEISPEHIEESHIENRPSPKVHNKNEAQKDRATEQSRNDRRERSDRPQRSQSSDNRQGSKPQGKDFRRDDTRKSQNNSNPRNNNNMGFSKDEDEDNSRRRPQKSEKSSKDRDGMASMISSKPTTADSRKFDQKIKDKSKKTREDDDFDDGKPSTKNNSNHQKKNNSREQKQQHVNVERKKAIVLGNNVTVKEFSETIGVSVAEIVKKLMTYGMLVTINNEIDFDTAQLVAEELGIEVTRTSAKSAEDRFDDLIKEEDEDESKKIKRAPIVTVMGHVDHGKTSLLDAIRNSNVTDKEAGGITQHIGAYTVNHKGNKITFLDTPGHEAFTTMRSRGAKVTDVAVIVVAANDGVMPQTIEAIHHAKAAETPIIIAMNKMDLYGVNPDTVKKQLAENDILVTDWGGDVECIPVSAKTRDGIDDLLEMILLVSELLELKANPDTKARGTIIEARLDKSKGPVATILVQNGTLREGDTVVAGMTLGSVRAMFDHNGKRIKKAGPSIPVEITGLNDVPQAGDMIYAIEDSKLSKSIVEERISRYRESTLNATKSVSLDDLFNQIKQGDVKTLNLVIKADVQGSVEAVRQSLEKLSNDEVKVSCIHGAVGAITEADISLAKASNAIVIGFNVRAIGNAEDLAQSSGVDIRHYSIIYNAIDDVTAAMNGMLAPVYKEVIHGRAEVRMTFRVSGVGMIAGSYVTKGKIMRHDKVRIIRDGIVIYESEMESLKRFKDDAKEVAEGYECGIGIKNFSDIKELDIIEAYAMEEVERK